MLSKSIYILNSNFPKHLANKIVELHITHFATIEFHTSKDKQKSVHFVLQNLHSYLMTTTDAMLNESLLPTNTLMAYDQGNKYCERISSAKTDMHNALHINKKILYELLSISRKH